MHSHQSASVAAARDEIAKRYGSALLGLSYAQRGFIVAASGKKLVASDLSNIEGRVNAWVAGEAWKLDAFRAYDTVLSRDASGKAVRAGPDLYVASYARAWGVPIERVTKDDRQIGKVMELALGYQGGYGAFAAMGLAYGVHVVDRLEDAPRDAKRVLTREQVEDIKTRWRAAHPRIRATWYALQDAALAAIETPYKTFWVNNRIAYRFDGVHLYCRLPSSRCITYPYASIGDGTYGPQMQYWGIDSRPGRPKKWSQLSAYGGMLCENVVQGIAADILMCAFERIEDSGFPIIMHVHDEVVCEVAADDNTRTHVELARLMTAGEKWSLGLPLASDGWAAQRYRK